MSSSAAAYLGDREADIVLRGGSTVQVRAVRASDDHAIRKFLEGISRESMGFRFFGGTSLDWATSWSTTLDYPNRVGLVAETSTPHVIVAHGAYVRIDAHRAEIAFLVADEWQGRGISTILLAHLAELAVRRGISTFTAEVRPDNHRMIEVFRESGFPVDMHSTADAIEIELPTSLSKAALERFDRRERSAAVAARPRCANAVGRRQ